MQPPLSVALAVLALGLALAPRVSLADPPPRVPPALLRVSQAPAPEPKDAAPKTSDDQKAPAEKDDKDTDEAKDTKEEKRSLSLADYGIKGKLIYKNYSFFRNQANDGNFVHEGIFQPEFRYKLPGGHRFFIIGDFRNDDDGHVHGVAERFPDTRLWRSAAGIKETVLELDLSPVRLNLGKQRFNWGTADAFNPTDQINPWDQLDPVDREKIAVWSASGTTDVLGANVQVVVVPLFTPSKEPLPYSRWVETRNEGTSGAVGFGLGAVATRLTNARRDVPATELATMQYGMRVKSTIHGVDASISYYDGYEPSAVFRKDDEARQTLQFTRIKSPGVDFSTTWRKFEFHGEAVAKFVDKRGRDSRFHGIIGFNYTLDELDLSWLEQIVFVAEHARETILTSVQNRDFTENPGIASAFRDGWIGRAIVRFNQDNELSTGIIIDVAGDPSHYYQAKYTYKPVSWLEFGAGVDFFAGNVNAYWGKWHKNDRFFFTAKYLF